MKPASAPHSFWRMCLVTVFAASAFTAIGGVAVGGVTPAHAAPVTLWDNNYVGGVSAPASGWSICCTNSQHYGSSFNQFNDQAADDFTVPAGHQWAPVGH